MIAVTRLLLPLLAFVFFVTGESSAQDLHIGTRGGLNFATADAEGTLFADDVGTRTAFHAGILAFVDISRYLAVQTELLYTRRGFGAGDGDIELAVDYFEFPVLAVIKIPGNLSPHFGLGFVLGLESNCSVASAGFESVDCADAVSGPRTRGADSGLVFGGGLTLDIGFGSLLFDILYNLGVSDVSEPTDGVDSIKTRTLYLSLGLTRRIGAGNGQRLR